MPISPPRTRATLVAEVAIRHATLLVPAALVVRRHVVAGGSCWEKIRAACAVLPPGGQRFGQRSASVAGLPLALILPS